MVTRKHRESKPRATRPASKPAEKPAEPVVSQELAALRKVTGNIKNNLDELSAIQGQVGQHAPRIASVSARLDALLADIG